MFGEIEMEETGLPAVRVCDCGCWGLVTVCVFVCVRETWIKIRERSPTATKWRYSHSLCYTPVGIYMGINNLSAIDVWSVNWKRLSVLCICYSRICFMGPSYDCQNTEVCILINWQRTETGILCLCLWTLFVCGHVCFHVAIKMTSTLFRSMYIWCVHHLGA